MDANSCSISSKYSVSSSSFVELFSISSYRSTLLCSFIKFAVHSKSLQQIALLNKCQIISTKASSNIIYDLLGGFALTSLIKENILLTIALLEGAMTQVKAYVVIFEIIVLCYTLQEFKRICKNSTFLLRMHMSPILLGHATLNCVVWHLFVDS